MASNPASIRPAPRRIDAGPAGNALEADPAEPLLNRAVAATYNPGSTFKVSRRPRRSKPVSPGPERPSTTRSEPRAAGFHGDHPQLRSARCCGDGTPVTFSQAFVRSCNTIFGVLGMEVGAETPRGQAEAFGFNERDHRSSSVAAIDHPAAGPFDERLPGSHRRPSGARCTGNAAPDGHGRRGRRQRWGVMEPYLVDEVFKADASRIDPEPRPVVGAAMSPRPPPKRSPT